MKRTIAIVAIFLLVAMFTFGCAGTDTTKRGDSLYRGYSNPVVPDYNENIAKDTDDYTRDNMRYNLIDNNNYEDYMSKNNNYNDYMTDNNNLATNDSKSSIENLCNDKKEVENTTVAINDDTCYVGLDLKNNAELSETFKENLSTSIKRQDPKINKVYFTTDENAIDKLMKMGNNTTDKNWQDIKNLFR
ncbi:MAG: YhcN/YlaJ family sporulation lipoprotein [Eubacteriaceae bacterium]